MPRNNSNSIAKDALRQYIKTNKATPSVAVQLASLRLEYSELSHTLNQYMKKMRDVERIYPRSLPTQASGRWSTIDPPLTNFPKHCISPECPQGWHEKRDTCWSLRDCLRPDEGTWWLDADLDAIEARIFALKVRDTGMIHAVRDGLDIHTATACHLFHLTSPWDLQDPHGSVVDTDWRSHVQWRGKDDSRRGIAKNFRYGTQYCLKPEAVLSIKDLEQFDLSREEILELAHRYWNLTAAQQTAKFAHMQRIKRDKVARTLYGSRRIFFEGSDDTAKQGFNHEIQGTVVDYMNHVILTIADRWPASYLVHNAHDGIKVAFPADADHTSEVLVPQVKAVIEGQLCLDDLTVPVTATCKVIRP